jgi:hypothetical protein
VLSFVKNYNNNKQQNNNTKNCNTPRSFVISNGMALDDDTTKFGCNGVFDSTTWERLEVVVVVVVVAISAIAVMFVASVSEATYRNAFRFPR